MASAKSTLQILLTARDQASKEIAKAGNNITKSLKNAEGASRGFAGGLLAIGAATAALGAVGLNYAGQLESMQIALETVTGSSKDAARAMDTIKRVAAESPFFETHTLASFVQLMAASGQAIDEAVSSALGFGDVAAAFGKGNAEMTRMGNTLSQVIGKGKADVIDFRELVNAGWVSVRNDTAEVMGVTMAEFEAMVSAGEVGYDQIRQAAEKFTGSAAKQSRTWNALLQRMGESFQNLLAELVVDTGLFDVLKDAIEGLVTFMEEHGDDIAKAIKDFTNFAIQYWPVLVGIIIGGLTPAIYGLAVAFGSAVIALAPFLAAGAAIGLLAKVIIDHWTPISTFFQTLWQRITSFVNEHRTAIMILMAIFAPLLALVVGTIILIKNNWQQLGELVGKIWQGIIDGINAAMNWIREKINWFKNNWVEALGFVIGFFATLPIKLPLYVIKAIVAIINYLRSVDWGAVFASIGRAFDGVMGWVRQAALNLFQYLRNINWGAVLSGIGRGVGNGIIGLIEGALNGALSGIPGAPKINLPRFAQGTDFAPGGLSIVGERGPELVNLPRGSQVIPNHRLADVQPGQTVTIGEVHLHNQTDTTAFLREIAFEL